MIPVLAGYIGLSIADRPGFLVGMAGGAMAAAGATFASPGGDVPSGFLGALLAGFIGGYLTLCLEKACNKLPKALNGIKPVLIYPLGGLAIVGIMMCAVNPVMGILNDGLSNFLNSMGDSSKVLLGCILGGMMAIDMGGPFNKAAYVFGVAAISQGNFNIMAAVMLGGMVPPYRYSTGYHILQKQIYRGGTQERSRQLHYGTQLHNRRRYPLRRS
jgi:PTS system fructose-specific IIC component